MTATAGIPRDEPDGVRAITLLSSSLVLRSFSLITCIRRKFRQYCECVLYHSLHFRKVSSHSTLHVENSLKVSFLSGKLLQLVTFMTDAMTLMTPNTCVGDTIIHYYKCMQLYDGSYNADQTDFLRSSYIVSYLRLFGLCKATKM